MNEPRQETLEKKVNKKLDKHLEQKLEQNLPDAEEIANQQEEGKEEAAYLNLPTSQASLLTYETLSAGENISELPGRKKAVSHSSQMKVLSKGNARQIETFSGTGANARTVTIELADITKVGKGNTPAKKLLTLALIEANKQNILNGHEYISFPLQMLVDLGFYKSIRAARAGFYTGRDILTSIKVKGKDKEHDIDKLRVLFTGADIDKGQCVIYFNQLIDWSFIIQYFTLLPEYYFSLSNRASDLLFYICYLARQNTDALAKKGYFTISFRAIQHQLQLPSEVGNRKPYQQIKKPIEDALTEIENAQNSGRYQNELYLEPIYREEANIKDFLDNGYLRVLLKGKLLEGMVDIYKTKVRQIEKAEKKREDRIEKAKSINLAKRMEAEEKKAKEAEQEEAI